MSSLSTLPPAIRSLRPVKTLEGTLERGRLPHAILLKGDDLGTLESVAMALANSLLTASGKPESHPDYFTLRPAGKSRGIAVGKRRADEPNTMRSLIRDLNQTSNRGGYKVAVVHEADRMNAQAANAFLKTLEEPPPQTLILLLTTRPYDLMETIRSRCFQFRIPARATANDSTQWREWLADYREWIQWLNRYPNEARRNPDKAILKAYGLISRFVLQVEIEFAEVWDKQKANLSDSMTEEEIEALKTGLSKGIRDKLLIEIEENTRAAAIHLSHHLPFPATLLEQAIASLESITGLMALNMKSEVALESFFLKSLKIWTNG